MREIDDCVGKRNIRISEKKLSEKNHGIACKKMDKVLYCMAAGQFVSPKECEKEKGERS